MLLANSSVGASTGRCSQSTVHTTGRFLNCLRKGSGSFARKRRSRSEETGIAESRKSSSSSTHVEKYLVASESLMANKPASTLRSGTAASCTIVKRN